MVFSVHFQALFSSESPFDADKAGSDPAFTWVRSSERVPTVFISYEYLTLLLWSFAASCDVHHIRIIYLRRLTENSAASLSL